MSEKAAAEGKKKGKMPVIIVLVVVLMGGGFFGMKMKGGGAKEKPKVELGEKMVEMDEMLVNLSDVTTFLRFKIAFHFKKGFDESKFKDITPAVEDAVIRVLKSKSPNEVSSISKMPGLKREIAANVNGVLDEVLPDPNAKKEAEKEEGHEGEGEKGEKTEKAEKPAKSGKPKHPDWDSDTGPVLKVYFKAFAVQ